MSTSLNATQNAPRRASDRRVAWGRKHVLALALACVLLVGVGQAHRWFLGKIEVALEQTLEPSRPLDTIPLELGPWDGRDVPLPPSVLRAAHFDTHHVNRAYRHRETGARIDVFVGYVGRPRAHIGHRPDVCYAAVGYDQTDHVNLTVTGVDGTPVPSILYEFQQPGGLHEPLLVLSTFMVNGAYTQDPNVYGRYNARGANLFGERKAYIARIQASLSSTGNRERDLAVLEDFIARIAGPTASTMPYWQTEE